MSVPQDNTETALRDLHSIAVSLDRIADSLHNIERHISEGGILDERLKALLGMIAHLTMGMIEEPGQRHPLTVGELVEEVVSRLRRR